MNTAILKNIFFKNRKHKCRELAQNAQTVDQCNIYYSHYKL